MNYTELHGLSYIDKKFVLVGKATKKRSRGKLFWFCVLSGKEDKVFSQQITKKEASKWLSLRAGAEEVYECTYIK